jgi:outer membrane receptor protein involved in Fe transport
MNKTLLAMGVALCLSSVHGACAGTSEMPMAIGADAAMGTPDAGTGSADTKTLKPVEVNAKLDQSRNQLSPDTGASEYVISQKEISQLPLGDATPLNQVILQIPGVVQDSFGQLHVRGDHANLQYRINGVIIPESISGFGQSIDTRVIDNIKFLTGALPAQYGYRTAGVVDITTKTGTVGTGGSVSLDGGSFGTLNPGAEIYGTEGRLSYYATANWLESDIGIENPTPTRNAIHDHTDQFKGFGYLSYLLSDTTRLSLMFGATNNRFEIPNNPNQSPNFILNDAPPIDSTDLNERQREATRFGVASLQGKLGSSDYQMSVFQRYTSTDFTPDFSGDLQFNGIAAQVGRSSRENGAQLDIATPLNDSHTLRYGLYASNEHAASGNDAFVFPVDNTGAQSSTTPINIIDNSRVVAKEYSAYLQDEWHVTDKITVNYGLRADKVDAYISEGQISPRLGAVYQLSDDTTLHASYARYFTPPPTELIAPRDLQLFQNTTAATAVTQDDPVRSQRENYFDVGVSQKIAQSLTLGLDAYYRRSHNLIDEGQFGAALVFSPFNYARGRIHGVEFTANYDAGPINAYFNIASSHASGQNIVSSQYFFGQEELDYIATHYIHLDHDQKLASSGGVTYALNDTTKVGADYLYGSGLRHEFVNSAALPSYVQVNLSLQHTFNFDSVGKIDARLSAINVFDHVYELRDGSGVGVGAPQFGPRRGVYLGFKKDFNL